MKYLSLFTLALLLLVSGCRKSNGEQDTENTEDTAYVEERKEIQSQIRKVLHWAASDRSIELLPVTCSDSICTGFDMTKLDSNLNKLRNTHYFSDEFIENYNHLIRMLDQQIKHKEIEEWHMGDLPPFGFANDVNPWCNCQDIPYDEENPWKYVLIKVIELDDKQGKLTWTWGQPEGPDPFSYRFNVVKQDGHWKIDYMQGFDFNTATK